MSETLKQDIINNFELKSKVELKKLYKIVLYILKENPNNFTVKGNNDYVDAFVALGGNQNTSGSIKVDRLKLILNEFELIVDIDALLRGNGMKGDDITFELFCKIFDTPIFDDNQSLHSYFSVSL